MSEIKRVALTTVSDVKKPANLNVTKVKTVRLELNLFEPTADRFPEFNFSKLLHSEKKKLLKHSKTNGISDPFENKDEDDVARIAREFEEKYGNAYNSKKQSNRSMECCDRGAGYDESDSFIDNTEAYDEIIPEEVETAGGGFYINSGALEFKKLSNFERPDDILRMPPKPKKRALSSSSSSGESSSDSSESSMENEEETDLQNPSKIKNGHLNKKFKAVTTEKDVTASEKIELPKTILSETKKIEEDGGISSDSSKDMCKVIKTTTVKDMLRAKRDSLRKMELKGKDTSENNTDNDNEADAEDSEKESASTYVVSSSENSSDQFNCNNNNEDRVGNSSELKDVRNTVVIEMPENLSRELMINIISLTELCKRPTGKLNFFDANTSAVLLSIETEAKAAGNNTRNKIYAYLEQFIPFTKQTIMAKARKLRTLNEESKVNQALNNFRDGINEILPKLIQNYDAELVRFKELKALHNVPASNMNSEKPDFALPKQPKKRFPWNDNLRQLLYEVVDKQKNYFLVTKPKNETIDEFVNNFLKIKVFTLWPNGWIKADDLKKELERRKKTLAKETTIPNSIKTNCGDNTKAVLNLNNNNINKKHDNYLNTNNGGKHTKPSQNETEQPIISETLIPPSSSSLTITPIISNNHSNMNMNIPNNISKKHSNKVIVMNVDSGKFTADSKVNEGSKTQNSISISLGKSSASSNNSRNDGRIEKKLNSSNNSNDSVSSQTTPSKKSSDHSIISIISSPPTTIQSSTSNKLPTQPSSNNTDKLHNSGIIKSNSNHSPTNLKHTTNPVATDNSTIKTSPTFNHSNLSNDKPVTHIINVDNIKNKSEFANSISNNKTIISPTTAASIKECTIKVRSINNMIKGVDKPINKSGNHIIDNPINLSHADHVNKTDYQPKSKPFTNSNHQNTGPQMDDDSDSDCVEIVEIFPAIIKKKINHLPVLPINVEKSKKTSSNKTATTSSSSSSAIPIASAMTALQQQTFALSKEPIQDSSNKDPELDISKIMKDIQELQQYGSQVSQKVDNDVTGVNNKIHTNSALSGFSNTSKKTLQDIPDNHTIGGGVMRDQDLS